MIKQQYDLALATRAFTTMNHVNREVISSLLGINEMSIEKVDYKLNQKYGQTFYQIESVYVV